ncbi:DUF2807 domain-containing protein [Flavobacteriaceae bacterium F08102]|nr:DUF2807 domain-containing protein [Flavobacteriaceae bacterium F08102]
MKTSLKFFSLFLLFISSSCMFTGVKGNGNVRIENRSISDNFETIEISRGLVLDLTSSPNTALTVEADENLQELIKTEVEDGVLKIYSVENIWKSTAKTIHLATNHVVGIKASSGSKVKARDVIKTDVFSLSASSGANVDLSLEVKRLDCSATSGTDLMLKGSVQHAVIKASSGSAIRAKDLRIATAEARATSGANISFLVTDDLDANATSGGDIRYAGNPKSIKKNSSSGGNVRAL